MESGTEIFRTYDEQGKSVNIIAIQDLLLVVISVPFLWHRMLT